MCFCVSILATFPRPLTLENLITFPPPPPGKSLYTTIRELVENGLDAAESIGSLPSISVQIQELSRKEFNKHRGVKGKDERKDENLFKER